MQFGYLIAKPSISKKFEVILREFRKYLGSF